MSHNVEEDKVFSFEEDFQNSLLYQMVVDRMFYLKYSEHIKPTYFTNTLNQIASKSLSEFFSEFRKQPTFSELLEYPLNFETKEEELYYKKHISILENSAPETVSFVEKKVSEFCKRQSVIRSLFKAAGKIVSGKFEEIGRDINDAINIGEVVENDYDFFDPENIKNRRNSNYRDIVPTLIKSLDRVLKGGLAKRELGIVVGAPKKGKTTTMLNLATGALYYGQFVVYVTLEMPAAQIAHKVDSRVSGVTLDGIFESSSHERIDREVSTLKGRGCKFVIKEYSSGTLTVERLHKELQAVEARANRKIDIVFVDYLTILKTRSGEASTDGWVEVAVNLRGLAGEMNVPIWTAMQCNRSGEDVETITAVHVSKAHEIVGVVDVMLSFNQTRAESGIKEGRFYVIASRVGPSHVEIPVSIDRDYCMMGEKRDQGNKEEKNIQDQIRNMGR